MGYGEVSMKPPHSPYAKISCSTRVGDLVGYVGDYDNDLVGLGIVVKAYPHNSVVKWAKVRQFVSEKNTNLYIIAEGSKNVTEPTKI